MREDMEAKKDWEKLVRRLELLMRLKSFPVAFKMLEKKEELDRIPFMRRVGKKKTLCQLITLVRNFDWTVGADADDFGGPGCASIIGLSDIPEFMKNGTFRSIVWVKTKKDGKKYEGSIPRLPLGKYEAVAMAPLVYNPFEPDIVLIYANPAQMMLLINSLQFEDYEVMEFFCVGESSCSDAIARCYLTGKPSLTIPCYGERRYGHAQDEEMAMAVPAGMMEKALRGMEELYRRGIRYPISYAGAELDIGPALPAAYGSIGQVEALKGNGRHLLLGVTGGIASGKTSIANMLEELGAPIIDFDTLAREVVEPEEPAWKEIVSFFGDQVLQEDRTLDRKKLSAIVFNDIEKRKKLESFTQPRIGAVFMKRLEEIKAETPDAVIQVVIPLLIETNIQHMFDKILVVYTSRETQIERLASRDGISRKEAEIIIDSQLPIDEKLGYADYVVNNEETLDEARKQVEELWADLKEIQKAKK